MERPPLFRKKHLGQHFLDDRNILQREAELLSCGGRSVLEIGAGDGRLTEKILQQGPSSTAAVELDERFAGVLKRKFAKQKTVKIIQQDALEFLSSCGKPFQFQCVCGNIPYQISGPLFSILGKIEFARGVFCVQKEMAERIAASPGTSDWGRISIAVQQKFSASITEYVPAEKFSPPPKVDSAILLIEPIPAKELVKVPGNFGQVVSSIFSHRLKTVGHALYCSRADFGLGKEDARAMAKSIKYSDVRVFQLTMRQIAEIASGMRGMRRGMDV